MALVNNAGVNIHYEVEGSGTALAALAYTPWLVPALGLLALSGVFNGVFGILSRSLLLSLSDPAYHGRIMSLNALNHSFMPAGGLGVGWLADNLAGGAPVAMALMALSLAIGVLSLTALHPHLLSYQPRPVTAQLSRAPEMASSQEP